MRAAVTACTACCVLALTACSDDTAADDAGRLPAGQYPITLTATVEGQTVTRATSDNTWEGTEEVALQVGSDVKKYTVAANGTLAAHNDNNPFYWTSITEQKTVGAWYPHSATRPASFTVQADQSTNNGAGFRQSDLLYTSQSITYNASTPPQLTFKHLPVKVVVNLNAGDGVTKVEVQNATVTLVNQALTSGAITYNGNTGAASVAQAAAGNVLIPKVNASAASGYHKTVQALLVPQQMRGKQFVKITVGSGVAARTYYYVPKDNAANLEHGKQYTYNITVKKEKLEVTVSSSVSWTDSETSGNAAKAVFHVTMPAGHNQALTSSNNATQSGDGYDVTGSFFTLSYTVTPGDEQKGFLAVKGLCDVKRTRAINGGTTTYTFTYSNIRSDLWLNYTGYAEVGDFYYSDGSWSTDKDNGKTCIGVVFYAGRHASDDCDYSSGIGSGAVHGYVVALNDAHTDKCAWGGDGTLIGTSTNQDDFLGYSNTQLIIQRATDTGHLRPDDVLNDYPATYYISEYGKKVAAPSSSSGWYFPSTGQLKAVYTAKDQIQAKSDDYLSSSEYDAHGYTAYNVGSVSFSSGSSSFKEKDDGPAYVRAILTF